MALFVLVAVASLFTACKVIGAGSGSDPEEDIGNSALSVKAISAFSVTSPVAADGVIDETGHTIAVSVPSGTELDSMTVRISHTGASVSPAWDATGIDFTTDQTFTVTATDGSTAEYTVTVATDMVTGVSVSPATPTVIRGTSQAFTADVTKTGNPAITVTWDVNSLISSIDEFGVLTVPVDETASTLTVTATSTANPGVSGTATVTVTDLYSQTASGAYEWEVPETGDYEIELTGASGGTANGAGGKGGTVKGTIRLMQGDIYEIRVGGVGANGIVGGSEAVGGYNGGGKGGKGLNTYPGGAGGGGASDMRTSGGDYSTRIIVAGGGGGGAKKVGGAGYSGGNAGNGNGGYSANGGNGGAGATMTAYYATGIGGNGATTGYGDEGGAGGGGGYYGANATGRGQTGGGGSSWADTGDGMFTNVTPAANGGGTNSGNGKVRINKLP